MSADGNMTLEYLHAAKERFQQTGKLFLVDYSKSCAAEVLLSILKDDNPPSFLMIAENPVSAIDYGHRLKKVLNDVSVILSADEFEKVIGCNLDSVDYTRIYTLAKNLSSKHKHIVLSAIDKDGNPLLNKVICRNSTRSGSFSNTHSAPYCISDMLSESGYDFVAVDGIYSMISFNEECGEETPGNNDLLTLFGKYYYSDVSNSYKRLERLVCSAEKRILISEVAFKDDVINFYAALNMINSDFSAVKMRNSMQSDYFNEFCDSINTAFSYYCSDDSCISECMQKLRDSKGFVPIDIESMNKYFSDELSFISDEEKILRCAKSAVKLYFSNSNPGLDAIVEMLMTTTDYVTGCILDMFFGNKLKERLESSISKSLACKLTSSEYKALFDIFVEYGGVYHCFDGADSKTKVVRIVRDNSGFEYFIRRRSKYIRTDEFTYSVMGNSSPDVYKCTVIARILEGKDSVTTLPLPMLVVTESDPILVASQLAETVCGNFDISYELSDLDAENNSGKKIVVCNVDDLRFTAKSLSLESAIFYDALSDVTLLKRIVNKTLQYGAKTTLVVSDYSNMQAHVMDYWQSVLFDGGKYLPFDNSIVNVKENLLQCYDTVVKRIETEYSLLAKIVRGGQHKDVQDFSKRFGKLLLEYTLMTKVPEDTILTDVEYLAKLGAHFNSIFKNTCTVGDEGDLLTRKQFYYSQTVEDKETVTTVETEESNRVTIFFNACSKILSGGCDLSVNSCLECSYNQAFVLNDLNDLVLNTREFFKKTLDFDAKMESDKINGVGNVSTISIDYGGEDEDDDLVASQIIEWRKDAEAALDSIMKLSGNGQNAFICDYELAEQVRDAAYKTYRKMIRKYYITLRDLFDSSTKKAIDAYRTSFEGVAIAHDDK